jgi:hypothetical protein
MDLIFYQDNRHFLDKRRIIILNNNNFNNISVNPIFIISGKIDFLNIRDLLQCMN